MRIYGIKRIITLRIKNTVATIYEYLSGKVILEIEGDCIYYDTVALARGHK